MNSGKIAIMGASSMALETIGIVERLKDKGFELSVVKEESVPNLKPNIGCTINFEMPPVLEPCDLSGILPSKHGTSEICYSKRITKRRKRNKNKKTHRKIK